MKYTKPALKMILWAFILPVVILTSCKDDEDPVIDEANLAGTWVYGQADSGDQFSSALVDALLEGTRYTFNSDGSYEQTTMIFGEASTEGTWEFSSAVITLDAGSDIEQTWEVVELSAGTLVYTATTVDDESGEETKVTFTYNKQ